MQDLALGGKDFGIIVLLSFSFSGLLFSEVFFFWWYTIKVIYRNEAYKILRTTEEVLSRLKRYLGLLKVQGNPDLKHNYLGNNFLYILKNMNNYKNFKTHVNSGHSGFTASSLPTRHTSFQKFRESVSTCSIHSRCP